MLQTSLQALHTFTDCSLGSVTASVCRLDVCCRPRCDRIALGPRPGDAGTSEKLSPVSIQLHSCRGTAAHAQGMRHPACDTSDQWCAAADCLSREQSRLHLLRAGPISMAAWQDTYSIHSRCLHFQSSTVPAVNVDSPSCPAVLGSSSGRPTAMLQHPRTSMHCSSRSGVGPASAPWSRVMCLPPAMGVDDAAPELKASVVGRRVSCSEVCRREGGPVWPPTLDLWVPLQTAAGMSQAITEMIGARAALLCPEGGPPWPATPRLLCATVAGSGQAWFTERVADAAAS